MIESRSVSKKQGIIQDQTIQFTARKAKNECPISVSLIDGISKVDRISWDAYNESEDLKNQIEGYRKRRE